jgi:hypothetical protein
MPTDLSVILRERAVVRGAVVRGAIYRELHPDLLLQDILEIDLPSGKTIDVGWYPEHDVAGAFRVRLYRGNILDLVREVEIRDPDEVIHRVVEWIRSDKDIYPMSSAHSEFSSLSLALS